MTAPLGSPPRYDLLNDFVDGMTPKKKHSYVESDNSSASGNGDGYAIGGDESSSGKQEQDGKSPQIPSLAFTQAGIFSPTDLELRSVTESERIPGVPSLPCQVPSSEVNFRNLRSQSPSSGFPCHESFSTSSDLNPSDPTPIKQETPTDTQDPKEVSNKTDEQKSKQTVEAPEKSVHSDAGTLPNNPPPEKSDCTCECPIQ